MHALRQLIYLLADLLGVNFICRRLTANRVRVLMYHGVAGRSLPSFYWTVLDREKFVRQMGYVKKKFAVDKLSSLLTNSGRRDRPLAAITFDDGLENTYTDAWPILKEHDLVATCFVVPGLSESGRRIWADELYARTMADLDTEIDLSSTGYGIIPVGTVQQRAGAVEKLVERLKAASQEKRAAVLETVAAHCGSGGAVSVDGLNLMSGEQIVELARSSEFEIAGHSDSHPILAMMTPDEQEREIASCLSRLKSWGLDPPAFFAYPNGREADFDEYTIAALKRHDCRAAVTTVDGLWDLSGDSFRIPRIAIGADISMPEFKCRMSGLFYVLRRVRHLMRRRSKRREA